MQYNTEQQEAILHEKGPALVLAGPGSGKTAVITGRVQALIQQYQIPPSQILVVTFTRAAAREMEERFRRESGGAAAVTFGTIHAICYKILKISRPRAAYSILSAKGRRRLLQEILSETGHELSPDRLDELEAEVLKAKSAETPLSGSGGVLPPELFEQVLTAYEAGRRERGLLDFEDLIRECLELFEDPAVLAWWRNRFRYLLVDEFQDVNELQYRFLQKLAGNRRNLFVVGDEDQTVYGFRGARQRIILDFPKQFPGAKIIRLSACYRCAPMILAAAGNMIRCNRLRFSKTLRSRSEEHTVPQLRVYSEKRDELADIARQIRKMIERGGDPDQIAVLCRTRYGLRQTAAVLWKQKIPYRSPEMPEGDGETPAARDIFAYLRLAEGGSTREDYLRIANKPLRYLPRRAFVSPQVGREALWRFAADRPSLQDALLRLFFDLDRMAALRPYARIEYLRREMGLEKYYREQEAEKGREKGQITELLDRLQEESAPFATAAEWESAREEMKQETAEDVKTPAVRLMTMHGAKGLEFDTVFLPGLNEGVIPGPKSISEEDVEAERRLLYVAMTRARRDLKMSFVTKHRGTRLYPSRFLKETGLKAEKGP
ncbi:MAG: ATP-dependent helicase [Lachnospiraceae bacterium]|nr:ATP-dependent helicase [Lachnospiraceae bacterium]